MPTIPSDLLYAVSAEGGGRLSVVIGAGCSIEPPTAIPLAGDLAVEANRRLVHDFVLGEGECKDPSNLAALATLIFSKTESQEALVERLPINHFRTARPNEGYRLLVALMAEGAVSHVLSLNFDLAVQNAASELGLKIHVVETAGRPIPTNSTIVHLHGSVNSSSDKLILREEAINDAWKHSWQEVVAQQILATPNVLFVGLGSAAPVLSKTVAMIVEALGHQKHFYQADTRTHAVNSFAQQLHVSPDNYIEGGWCDTMSALAKRLAREHVDSLMGTCVSVLRDNDTSDIEIDRFREIARRLEEVSLLALGKFRSYAQLNRTSKYVPRAALDEGLLAGPLTILAMICAKTGVDAVPGSNGLWMLKRGNRIEATVLVATGGGTRRLAALEISIRHLSREIAESSPFPPTIVLLGAVASGISPNDGGAPLDIVEGNPDSDIVSGPSGPCIIIAEGANAVTTAEGCLNANTN